MGKFCPPFYGIIYIGAHEIFYIYTLVSKIYLKGQAMKTPKNFRKTVIVHILKIVYAYTSPQFPATQTAIVNYLNDIGIPCCRKTVARNLGYLMDMGVPIKRVTGRNGGYYFDIENDNFFVRMDPYIREVDEK